MVVPFRESKLTLLFQNYFVGKGQGLRQGKITMLVNVSNNASVFDETSHVLEFSALTSKVRTMSMCMCIVHVCMYSVGPAAHEQILAFQCIFKQTTASSQS